MDDRNKIKDADGSQRENAFGRSEAELRYEAVFDQSPDGILIIDAEGKIVDFNKAAHTDLGYTREEFSKFRITDIDPVESPEEIRARIQRVMSEKKAEFEVTHRTKSGQLRNVLVITQTIVLSGRTVFHAIWRDITDQKAAEKKIRYLASILEHVPDAVCSFDTDCKLVAWNEGAERMLGYKAGEIIGRPIQSIIPEETVREEVEYCIDELNKGEVFAGHETLRIAKDGRRVPVEISGLALREGRKITGYASIMRDITKRKRAEDALQQSEERLRLAMMGAADGLWDWNLKTDEVYYSPRWKEMLGYGIEELEHNLDTWKRLVHPDDMERTLVAVSDLLQERSDKLDVEFRMRHKDGHYLSVLSRAFLAHDSEGKVSRLVGTHVDITSRKRAEENLRKSEARLRESQKVARIGSWSWNVVDNTLEWSDEACRRFDKDPETFTPSVEYFVNLIHPEDREAVQKAMQATLKNDTPYHIQPRIINESGREWVLEGFGIVERDINGIPLRFAGTVQDITERKKAEAALRESEEKFRMIFDRANDGMLIADISTKKFVAANQTICRMLGYTEDEILTKGLMDIHPEEAIPIVIKDFETQMKGEERIEADIPVKRKDGTVFYAEILAAPLEFGNMQYAVGIFHDISARKEAEEKIRQSEAFIRKILDTVDEGFIVIDRDFRILTVNKAYCSQVGESCDLIIGRHCYEVSHKTLRPCFEEGEECAVRHAFETGEPHAVLHKHRDAKGSVLYVETKAFPIKDSSGAVTSVIETVNNITEKHLLEEEQLKIQKLEAIGTLAGGIAHDFNNLLQGVFGYISMAKMTLDQKERSLTMLEQAEKALHISVDLTTQLLTFSKGGKPLKKKIQLQSVIENSVRFALSGSRVDFRIKFDENLWSVDADEGQIGQVVQNIVLNADQAMPVGGTINVAVRNVSAPGEGLPASLAKGKYIEISVKDDGIGIPKQYINRLFDPYFTTKEKGSGLGLATSYSIIKNHGGLIDVESQLGKGSTFLVYLPAFEAEGERFVAIPATADAVRRGRILVMDDEELVRNIVGIMLKALGHEVDFAENGEDAIAKYREALSSGRRFDIVILDLTIRGGMGGEEALRELLALDPEVKAVVSSGYVDSSTISEYQSRGFNACLAKPYEVDALREVLNVLLK
jgi:two-component system, cell cycle sensor histidine kinase and response regulator CckA